MMRGALSLAFARQEHHASRFVEHKRQVEGRSKNFFKEASTMPWRLDFCPCVTPFHILNAH
jgi:hypothetical protein